MSKPAEKRDDKDVQYRLGVDVGGTFTDFVYIDNQNKIKFSKVLTT